MKINYKSIGFLAVSILLLVSWLPAQTPNLLNYQGKLTAPNGKPLNGTYTITFRIYPDTLTQNDKWLEEHKNVKVVNGIFNVLLGSSTPFRDLFTQAGDRYLGITLAGDLELKPRFRLTSVAYSMHANSANLAQALVGSPVVARWYATNHGEQGPVPYKWGNELFNTALDYLSVSADGTEINVKKAGYYLVCVNVLQTGATAGERGNISLKRNEIYIKYNLEYAGNQQYIQHNFSIIEYFHEGDRILIICDDHYVYGNSPHSSLEIYKLN